MKNQRQQTILSLIKSQKIRTHEQLVDELSQNGFSVTQATVSRDIKELGIVKLSDGEGSFYAAPFDWENPLEKYAGDVVKVALTGNLVVVHTNPGMASAVCAAVDKELKDVTVGTIAGDDTIFIALADASDAKEAKARLEQYFMKQ